MTEDPRILELRQKRAKALQGGGEKRIEKQKAKGKLTARERVQLLLDPDTFNELEPFITSPDDEMGLTKEKFLGDGVITGYGQIDGRTVYVYAQDFTIYGGTLSEMQSRKICRVMDLSMRNGTPCIGLLDFRRRTHSGRCARTRRLCRDFPAQRAIFGRYSADQPDARSLRGRRGLLPCPARPGHHGRKTVLHVPDRPGCHQGRHRRKRSTSESLGGTDIHMQVSGVAHLAAKSEQDALALARQVLSYLPSNNMENPTFVTPEDDPMRMDEALNQIVPLDPTEPYNMHAVIQSIVDKDTFLEIQPGWAQNAVVGLARIGGHSVGIVAQEPSRIAGVIDIDASDKMTRFVRMCDCFNVPLVTFVDSPGFLPGIAQEHGGIIRHGAKLLYAYSEATVPKVTIITRKAYGGAYVVMSSKYLGTDVTYAWPSAEIAVLGAEGAANILFKRQIEAAENPAAERKRLADDYRETFNNPYYAAGAGYIDEIIEPRESRPKIIAALSALRDKFAPAPPRKHGNIPV